MTDLKVIADKFEQPYAELRMWAAMFDDIQQERIRMQNRTGIDNNGAQVRAPNVDIAPYLVHWEALKKIEHSIGLDLSRCYRRVAPSGVIAWQKVERGIGEHELALLLGYLGHPCIATPHTSVDNPKFDPEQPSSRTNPKTVLIDGEPFWRGVGQLRQFCGHGSMERKRVGMSQADALHLGSPRCKMQVHRLAESCVKQPDGSRYRDLWVADRLKRGDVYDPEAPPAKRWTSGGQITLNHSKNRATRRVGKEILKDLWTAAGGHGGLGS